MGLTGPGWVRDPQVQRPVHSDMIDTCTSRQDVTGVTRCKMPRRLLLSLLRPCGSVTRTGACATTLAGTGCLSWTMRTR